MPRDPASSSSRPLCPLFVDLTGRLCVVVGGGRVAERRARTLREGGATLRVVAPGVTSALAAMSDAGEISLALRDFAPGDLTGAFLAVAATGIDAVDSTVASEARSVGCLFNSASESETADTIVPAEVRRGRLRIAISSSGASPTLSGRIRRRIEDDFGPEWEAYLDALATLRERVRTTVRDSESRTAILELASDPEQMRAVIAGSGGDAEGLLGWLAERVEAGEGAQAGPHVALVGAGPGDPGLITAKGLARLREADVVIYDHLVDERLVAQAPAHAERIYVGKRGGHDYIRQEQINELIVAKALEHDGQRVVRLKGGDPYVFGRGGEEALALLDACVPFEVVSGVSSGYAAAAAAGIPVTHRGLSTSVLFVTGHEDPTKGRFDVDWPHVAKAAETICVFMGVRNAASISEGLMAGGRPGGEPVAVIRWGSTPQQETLVTTLAELPHAIEEAGITPPALLVVGKVVTLRERLGDNLSY